MEFLYSIICFVCSWMHSNKTWKNINLEGSSPSSADWRLHLQKLLNHMAVIYAQLWSCKAIVSVVLLFSCNILCTLDTCVLQWSIYCFMWILCYGKVCKEVLGKPEVSFLRDWVTQRSTVLPQLCTLCSHMNTHFSEWYLQSVHSSELHSELTFCFHAVHSFIW